MILCDGPSHKYCTIGCRPGSADVENMMCKTSTRLSVVIPALDEAARLPSTIRSIDGFLAVSPDLLPAEIVVVDDGSTDDTLGQIQKISLSDRVSLRTFRHPQNRGKGAAVRTGFSHSTGASVLLCDADLATPIEEIRGLAALSRPDTVVIGSRAVNRALIRNPQPRYRDFMGRGFNLLVRALVLPGVRDTQCGFKLFPGSTAHAMSSVQRLDGFAYDVELLALADQWGMTIIEHGVVWRHVEASRVLPGRHSAQMFCDLIRLAWWRWVGLPPERPGVQ